VDVFGIGRLEEAVNKLAGELQTLTERVETLNSTVDTGISETRDLINTTNYETRRLLGDAIDTTRQDIVPRIEVIRADISRLSRPEPQPAPTARPEPEEEPEPEPAGATEPARTPIGHESDAEERHEHFLEALVAAARITNVRLICHRDLWAFLVQNVAHARHFRVPDKVKALDNGRIRVVLSGPSLIAALTALRKHQNDRTPDDELGDWAQALVLYTALTDALCGLEEGARPEDDQHIDITLDLCKPTAAEAAEPESETGDESESDEDG
jgi:hypothetical protein